MDRIHIFDTTLRDGEQSPGFSMNRDEKLLLARQLEQLGGSLRLCSGAGAVGTPG